MPSVTPLSVGPTSLVPIAVVPVPVAVPSSEASPLHAVPINAHTTINPALNIEIRMFVLPFMSKNFCHADEA